MWNFCLDRWRSGKEARWHASLPPSLRLVFSYVIHYKYLGRLSIIPRTSLPSSICKLSGYASGGRMFRHVKCASRLCENSRYLKPLFVHCLHYFRYCQNIRMSSNLIQACACGKFWCWERSLSKALRTTTLFVASMMVSDWCCLLTALLVSTPSWAPAGPMNPSSGLPSVISKRVSGMSYPLHTWLQRLAGCKGQREYSLIYHTFFLFTLIICPTYIKF